MRTAVLLTLLILTTSEANAAITRGAIGLMDTCPGTTRSAAVDGNEGLVTAILSPILTFAVNQGLKTAGARLQEKAKEATVDILQRGDHFYIWKNGGWVIQHTCVVVVSKETKTTKKEISESYKGYPHTDELVDAVVKLGFAKDDKKRHKPGVTAVFQVELSDQGSEFRLVPLWIGMSHSVREKRSDSAARDVTFEFSYAIPGSDKPLTAMIKFEGAKVENAIDTTHLATQWMPVPALNQSELTKQTALREARSKEVSFEQAAKLAGVAANALGAADWTPPGEAIPWNPVLAGGGCHALSLIPKKWRIAHGYHTAEQAKPKANRNAKLLAMLSNAVSYFENCSKSQGFAKEVTDKTPNEDKMARSYDLSINIKEFRRRPVAQFFGDALSDETTRSSLASAILGEIDPQTRKAAKEADELKLTTALAAYEQARLAAELASIEFDNASVSDRAMKLLDLDYKKRAANRAAIAAGVDLPYPDKGTWVQ